MEDRWTEFLEHLKKLRINYSEQNPSQVYSGLQNSIKIDQVIGYKNRPKAYDGVFHFALSVQVLSSDSSNNFIPFVFILHGDENKRKIADAWVKESIQNKWVRYNYTEFFDDVRTLINQDELKKVINGNKPQLNVGGEFSNITFKSGFSRSSSRYTISDIYINSGHRIDNHGIRINSQETIDAINALLVDKGENADFINLLSNLYYKDVKVENLYFAIYGLDGDYRTGSRLTHFIIVADNKEEIDEFCIQDFYGGYIRKIRDIASYLRTRYIFDLIQKNEWEATKSAKAAIMSRNMSHNLGSHVMFYIKQKLQSVSKIVDNKVLDNIIPGNIEKIDDIIARIKENKDVELPFLVGLGRFINYLQERQDYIATVATDYIPARSTISFKDFIYDELKPELRYLRHHADNPKGEAGWQSGNLLLDYIAYSEDYCSSDDIVIRFGDFDGEHSKDDKGKEIADFQNLRKFNVAIPGGVIGRQAIFSIFENIIRNAAKHSERRDDNKLVLQLSLLKDKEELNKLGTGAFRARREGDNEKYATELVELYKNYWDSYHYLRIKIDMPNQQNSIEKLIESLADPYLENGVMKDSAKGLKEMRISAAWLRGYDIDTKIPLSEPPVLSIYSEPYNGDNEKMTISYILCIPKPKKVALLVNDNSSYKNLNDSIEPFGCKIFGYQNDVFDKNNNFNNTIPNYEIVCMLDDADINKKVYPQISSRHITSSEITLDIVKRLNNICKDTTDKDQKHALLKLEIDLIYEIWYEHWCQSAYPGRKDYKLTILDDKTIDNSKTDSLKEKYAIADSQTVILDSTGNIKLDYCTNAVVYKTHFKGLQTESNDSYLTSAVCIESITGNNSTARFIRQDKWNKMWKSKLLSSGIAKVAIFDERIYSTFVPSKGIRPITEIYDLIKEKSEKEIVEVLTKEGFTEGEAYAVAYEDPGFHGIIENKCKKYNVEVAQKNHERGVWAFDIEPENDIVKIKGYNVCIEDKVNAFETRYPSETVVATIKKCGEQYDIVDVNDKIFPKGTKIFDFVSIHLGILDKIYNAFKIKGNEIEMRKVTNAIHKYFAKAETPLDYNEFLPNFIIHSGRAKPSKLDMPQEQPFVQFAAIDYAVKDCKCTLVELLISAYHENSNSNN